MNARVAVPLCLGIGFALIDMLQDVGPFYLDSVFGLGVWPYWDAFLHVSVLGSLVLMVWLNPRIIPKSWLIKLLSGMVILTGFSGLEDANDLGLPVSFYSYLGMGEFWPAPDIAIHLCMIVVMVIAALSYDI